MAQSWKAGEARRGDPGLASGVGKPRRTTSPPSIPNLVASGSVLAPNAQQGLPPTLTLLSEETRDSRPQCSKGVTSRRLQKTCWDLPRRLGALGSGSQACHRGVAASAYALAPVSRGQGEATLVPNGGGSEKACSGAQRSGRQGLTTDCGCWPGPGAHSPCREQPGDLRGGRVCSRRLSQGQWPPPGLQLSPHKASVGLA